MTYVYTSVFRPKRPKNYTLCGDIYPFAYIKEYWPPWVLTTYLVRQQVVRIKLWIQHHWHRKFLYCFTSIGGTERRGKGWREIPRLLVARLLFHSSPRDIRKRKLIQQKETMVLLTEQNQSDDEILGSSKISFLQLANRPMHMKTEVSGKLASKTWSLKVWPRETFHHDWRKDNKAL